MTTTFDGGEAVELMTRSARIAQAIRIDSEYAAETIGLVCRLTDRTLSGRCWIAIDEGAWEDLSAPLDSSEQLERLLGDAGASPEVITDMSRFAAAGGFEPVPSALDVRIRWRVERTPSGFGDWLLVLTVEFSRSGALGIAGDNYGARLASVASAAADLESELLVHLDTRVHAFLFDCDVLRDEFTRSVFDRVVSSPYIYVYEIDSAAEPNSDCVRAAAKINLDRSGPESSSVDASFIDGETLLLRRSVESPDVVGPYYMLFVASSTRSIPRADSMIRSLVAIEVYVATQMWDLGTDVLMQQDHLYEHQQASGTVRELLDWIVANDGVKTESHLRGLQRVLMRLQQAAASFSSEARSASDRLLNFERTALLYLRSSLDEKRVAGAQPFTEGLAREGLVASMREEVFKARNEWETVQRTLSDLHAAAGRIVDDRRADELARLERQGSRMSLLLAFLAVVLAFEALVDFHYETAPALLISALRIATVVVAILAALGILHAVFGPRQRGAFNRDSLVATCLQFASRLTEVSGGADANADRVMSREFCTLWESASNEGDPAERRQALSILRAGRLPYLYRGPNPWLACAYHGAFGISGWEFERTVADWGFFPHVQSPRLRKAILEARAAGVGPAAMLDALESAGIGAGTADGKTLESAIDSLEQMVHTDGAID
ncbi:MAG: hypothetical protein S0880_37590 [Actinomycetota bacterium]|nr:hypothetical protein [Actinomycetota bacterium]